jgi:hypothetical protein
MYNPSNYKVGPRGGVYTVDFDGTRHYLDREQARRYIAELTAKRSSAAVREEPSEIDPVETAPAWVAVAGFVFVLSVFVGCFFAHPFWLVGLTFQLTKALLCIAAAILLVFFQITGSIGQALWHVLTA